MQWFWLWLCRFAYRRLKASNPNMPIGVPNNRDPESPCPAFDPRPTKMGDYRDCEGDGHFLCKECRWFIGDRKDVFPEDEYEMLNVGDEWRDGDEYGTGFRFVVGTSSTSIQPGDKVDWGCMCYKPRRRKKATCGRQSGEAPGAALKADRP